jgi:hypothetical protein
MDTSIAERQAVTGTLKVMDHTGDLKIVWDSSKKDEVDAAKASFDKMIAKGYSAFASKKNGEPGTRIAEFDPEAEAIILVPKIVGG